MAALPGAPASPNALEVLDQAGIDLTGHTSQPVTEQLVAWADLVLTMTSRHLSAVVGAFPDSSSKVQLLCPEGMSPIRSGAACGTIRSAVNRSASAWSTGWIK